MEVKIRPRKATDRGGYYCMPLYTNIQHGACGLCTMCAIKKGVGA